MRNDGGRRRRRRRTEDCCGMFAVRAKKTGPSHLSGLDPSPPQPDRGVKGRREHLKETRTHTRKNTNTCESFSPYFFFCSLSLSLRHNLEAGRRHLCISSLISVLLLFVLLILSAMLTLGRETIDCRVFEKHTMAPFFPKQINQVEEEEKFWATWIQVRKGRHLAPPLYKHTLR